MYDKLIFKKRRANGCCYDVQQVTSVILTVMNGIKFKFNDIIPLYTKNDSESRQSAYDITKYI